MLHEIYSELLGLLKLKPSHEKQLEERGFTPAQIAKNGYTSLDKTGVSPSRLHSLSKIVEKLGYSLTDAAGFYFDKGAKNPELVKPFYSIKKGDKQYPCNAIVIPVRDRSGLIKALKLRLDTKIATRKYKYLSSKGYPNGKPNDAPVHFPLGFDKNLTEIRVTEGEFKADYATLNTDIYTISIAGVTMWRTALEEINSMPMIRKIYLAPDADKDSTTDPYTGEKVNRNKVNQVARSFACLAAELKQLGYDVVMEDWNEAYGKGIDDVLLGGNKPRSMADDELDEFVMEHGKPSFKHVIETKTGYRVLPTKENTVSLLEFLGVTFRYNQMKHNKEVYGNNKDGFYPDNINNSINLIRAKASMYSFPVMNIPELIELVAADNAYHPAKLWIESRPWDGVSRIEDLMNTLIVDDPWINVRNIYMKRWLISGIAALYAKNYWTKICLTLAGKGSIGKTTWFEKLFGDIANSAFKDGLILDPSNKDSRFAVISNWCVELGEIAATFRKRDREELKAFITERADDFRTPYSREPIRYPRQCFFGASVDQMDFLKDEAGDIRFACLPVNEIDLDHNINMQQVWAEVKQVWFEKGETWFLQGAELDMIKDRNQTFKDRDVYEDLIYEAYGFVDEVEPEQCRYMTARQVCEELYNLEYTLKKPEEIVRRVSKALRMSYPVKPQSVNSKASKQWLCPPIKPKDAPNLRLINGDKERLDQTDSAINPSVI